MRSRDDRIAQTARNVEAWCAHFGAPEVAYLEHRWQPLREDRVLIHSTTTWLEWLHTQTRAQKGAVYRWDEVGNHHPLSVVGVDEKTALGGWRGRRVFAAIQIIYHLHHNSAFLEIDFDGANPATGSLGAVAHGLEWAWYRLPMLIGKPKRLTDPFRIARKLRKAKIMP